MVREGMAARRSMGVVPQEIALYDDLSAQENLAYWGGAQGLRGAQLHDRISEVLELTGLRDRAKEPIKRFSGGMKRRLNFACGIVHQPKVLLLDEPTVGRGSAEPRRLLELVREQARAAPACFTRRITWRKPRRCAIGWRSSITGASSRRARWPELRALLGERDCCGSPAFSNPSGRAAGAGQHRKAWR